MAVAGGAAPSSSRFACMCREVTKGDNNKSFVPPETRGEELNKAGRVKSESLIDKPEKSA